MTIALRVGLVAGFTALAIGSATASDRASDEMACTPDVYRLCAAQIPDEDAIVTCLKAHKASLSAECGKVFASPTPGKTQSNDSD